MKRYNRYAVAGAVVAASLAVVAHAPQAQAQFVHRLTLHGELGVGTMLTDYQRDGLRYDSLGGELTLRAGVRVAGPLSVQLGVANWLWLRDQGSNGRLLTVDLGLRGTFAAGRSGHFWVDANVGPGFTGDVTRPAVNAGLGFDFALSRSLGVGPYARLGRVLQDTADPFPENATFWALGAHLTVRFPEPETAPPPPPDDRDGDGVIDPDDACVDVPQGANPDPARRGCPLGDRDGDGVLDPDDLCPTSPMGDEPDPARRGCPDNDSDGDGVVDQRDQCPLEPMDPTPDPDRLGCARVQTVINLGEISFETGSATILTSESNTRTLTHAQEMFTAHPEVELFSIEGHTDERDSDRRNLRLSRERAEAVRDWLVGHGIATTRMVPAGYGEYCPVNPGHDEAAWAQNRRVLFVIARRSGAIEAGARFGCAEAARYVPAELGTPTATRDASGGRHHRSRRHRHRH